MPRTTKINKSKNKLLNKIKREENTLLNYLTLGKYSKSSELPKIKNKVTPILEFMTGVDEQEKDYKPEGLDIAMSLPVLGSIKKSKDLVKLYRGIDKWRRGQQVKKGMHVGGITKNTYADMKKSNPDLSRRMLEKFSKNIYTTPNKEFAKVFAKSKGRMGKVLEYEVPKKYIKKYGVKGGYGASEEVLFEQGIPKEFFKKIK